MHRNVQSTNLKKNKCAFKCLQIIYEVKQPRTVNAFLCCDVPAAAVERTLQKTFFQVIKSSTMETREHLTQLVKLSSQLTRV